MLQTRVIGNTIVLSANNSVAISPTLFKNPLLLYVNLKKFRTTDYETVDVPLEEQDTEVYFNNNHLYLTNFILDQTVLPSPIDIIAATDLNVQVYISGKKFNFSTQQLNQDFSCKKFYSDMYHSFRGVRTEKSRKRKMYVENTERNSSLSASSELGVHTYQGSTVESSLSLESLGETVPLSNVSDSASPRDDESVDDFSIITTEETPTNSERNNVEQEEPFPVKSVTKVRKTILDTRQTKKIEIAFYKKKVISLQTECFVKTTDTVIFSDSLRPTKQYSSSDVIVNRMEKEILDNGNGQLSTCDPIVVIEKDGGFDVLSGNRRVHAFKRALSNKIWVSKIEEADRTKFLLTQFFGSKCDNDSDTSSLFNIVLKLLIYLELPLSTLKSWSPCERNQVFCSLFSNQTTTSLILEISSHEELKEAVVHLLQEKGWRLSNRVCKVILMVHRRNPSEVINTLKKTWNSETELRENLISIQPDVMFLLEEKKIESSIAKSLVLRYAGDALFSQFVRHTDLRYIKRSQEISVINKYEEYKKKFEKSKVGTPIKIITECVDESVFDILVTSNKETAVATLDRFDTVLVLLFGSTLPTTTECTIVLPDFLGVEDEYGTLNNHVTLSLCIKVDGLLLNQHEVTTYLLGHGVSNRTVFTLSQLKPLSQKLKKYFFHFGGIVQEELSLLLFTEQAVCIFEKQESKKNIERRLRDQRHASQIDQ
ncbi:hypothetical protein GCK72_021738 [Caenorhabditis remanei]|uniref:ParB/Sulfiredoxin domain-containing protein n=1 Tax=Caenorhabditis remanei TaxID=31234 RepID=A0A6A5GLL1_CAERE|nr:hypothetical protein GCK72_021738 [Caenorhabditis remanei]KAF1755169.1 hypothetical protein GCK72_021738 [Caenorhabditis remanei]